jgi:uncharacterized protein
MPPPKDQRPLVEFPSDYQFKVFGPADPDVDFVAAVQRAAGTVMPVPLDALRVRKSREGTYLCVTLMARLLNQQQLDALYTALRGVPQLRYLL